MAFRVLSLIGVLIIGLAFYARPRFPDTATHHMLKTSIGLGAKFIDAASYAGSLVGLSPVNITRSLAGFTFLFGSTTDGVKRHEIIIEGVEVVVFEPDKPSTELRPGLIHIHGGGWVVLTPDHFAPILQEIVRQTDSVVFSINYRRAPEVKFPVPVEDCVVVTRHLMQHVDKYGVDKNKMAIKGDSAGGNMALVVALNISRDSSLPRLQMMSLDYPALQLLDFCLPSYQLYESGPGYCTKYLMLKYWQLYSFGKQKYDHLYFNNAHVSDDVMASKVKQYVNKEYLPSNIPMPVESTVCDNKAFRSSNGKSATIPEEITKLITNPMYAPLMTSDEDLANLPFSYIVNAEYDVLRDEGFILAERLRRIGVEVEHNYYPNEEHGFINYIEIDPIAKAEIRHFSYLFHKFVKNKYM